MHRFEFDSRPWVRWWWMREPFHEERKGIRNEWYRCCPPADHFAKDVVDSRRDLFDVAFDFDLSRFDLHQRPDTEYQSNRHHAADSDDAPRDDVNGFAQAFVVQSGFLVLATLAIPLLLFGPFPLFPTPDAEDSA